LSSGSGGFDGKNTVKVKVFTWWHVSGHVLGFWLLVIGGSGYMVPGNSQCPGDDLTTSLFI